MKSNRKESCDGSMEYSMNGEPNKDPRQRPLTTRRGFIAAASLGAVSLYGLWAAFGAAPFRLFGTGGHEAEHPPKAEATGHAGHGVARGPSIDEFRRLTEMFIDRHRLPDGSVQVGAPDDRTTAARMQSDHSAHAGARDMQLAPGVSAMPPSNRPSDVYLSAQKWFFEPSVLRLRRGGPYRFRMMAVDASHGASIQLGRGSRIIRLRQGVVVEQELAFTRPGEYLVYCTIYCGIGHDRMSAKIVVS